MIILMYATLCIGGRESSDRLISQIFVDQNSICLYVIVFRAVEKGTGTFQ